MAEETGLVHEISETKPEQSEKPFSPERRKHPRYRIQHPIEYHFSGSPANHFGHTINVSEEGLEAAVAIPIETEKQVDINIHFPWGDNLVEIKASVKVIWADSQPRHDGFYHFGGNFRNISPLSLLNLRNLLSQFSLPIWIL